nr:hypothetical protein [Tanacetum cinerariifolium]
MVWKITWMMGISWRLGNSQLDRVRRVGIINALKHKSVIVKEVSHRVVVFKKSPSRAYSKPFSRFSLPYDVDGQVDYGNYGMKMVKEVRVEIHGFTFLVDFVVIGYANEGEPSLIFGRDFLEMKDIDVMLEGLVEKVEEVEEIPPISSIAPPSPIYHPLSQKQKEKVKEALDHKYNDLEESKPILEVLENYMNYQKELDEVMIGRARLSSEAYGGEENIKIVVYELSKKMCDLGNFMLPVRVNGTIKMSALADTGASPRAKAYLDKFKLDEKDDWMSCFEVGRNEDGNPKYGPIAPSFLDIKDDMKRALNTDWGNEGLGVYKKVEAEDSDQLTRHQPYGWRAMPGGWLLLKATQNSHLNPLVENYQKRNKQDTVEYHLQQVKNANLKWRELPLMERHAYNERLSKFQVMAMFFVDYSWERALSISGGVNPEWCLEFFPTMYFDKGVERTKLMTEKCIWFRLCGIEKVLTLPKFAVLLGLYEEDKLNHRLFDIDFTRLEVDDKLFTHEAFWKNIGTPTSTKPRTSLIKEPLMRIVHRLLHLCKLSSGLKENSLICGGHYVTKIASSLGYLVDEEVMKCSEPIECEKWTSKMLANELDEGIHTLMQTDE